MTRVLDIDLDFFVEPPAHWTSDDGDRLSDANHTCWSVSDSLRYLRSTCGVTGRLPGWVVEHHDEAFERWRSGIEDGLLEPPFHVTHLDAHADLGLGDAGYVHLLTMLMTLPVEDRRLRENLSPALTFSNWLAFAVACRWVSEIDYVYGPGGGSDLFPLYMTENGQGLQLMPWTRHQIARRLGGPWQVPEDVQRDPVVPIRQFRADEFDGQGGYDAILICRSPGYTPPAADLLFDAISGEFIDIIE